MSMVLGKVVPANEMTSLTTTLLSLNTKANHRGNQIGISSGPCRPRLGFSCGLPTAFPQLTVMKKTGPSGAKPFGMAGAGFGKAQNAMQGMMDLYGDLGGQPKASTAAPKRAMPSSSQPKLAPSQGVKMGGAIGNVKSHVATSKVTSGVIGQSKLTSSTAATSSGRKATMNGESASMILGMLKATIKPIAGDLGTLMSSRNVLERPGLRLFDFSEAGHTTKVLTDDDLNNQYSNMANAKDIYQNPTLTWNIAPTNVRQGQLGDCYILGSMAVIASQPQNIKRLLEDKGDSAEVWLCDSGCWRLVRLKKTFPVSGSKPTFASSKDNCIWQMVLEKAFACLYKGYDRLELGHSSAALRELTGCATEYIELDDPNTAWQNIKSHLATGNIITGSTKVSGLSDNGITPKHCYSILAAKEVSVGGKTVRYIQLMNPVSNSSNPPQLNAEAAKQLGSGQTVDVFWYQYASLLKNFEVLTCCKIKADLCYSWSRVSNPGQKQNQALFRLVGTPGENIALSFNHKNLRHYVQQNLDSIMKTKYGVARVVAFTLVQGGAIEILGAGFHALQNVKVDFTLTSNECFVFVDIDYEQKYLDEYTLAASSTSPVYIQREQQAESWLSTGENKADFIKSLLFSLAASGGKMQVYKNSDVKFTLNEYTSKSEGRLTDLLRYYGQALGYIAFVYHNKTKGFSLEETLLPVELKNVFPWYPTGAKLDGLTLTLKPGEAEVIVLKFGPANNCSHTSRIQCKYFIRSN